MSPTLLGYRSLPIGITISKRLAYTEREASRTAQEAVILAYAELDRQLAALSGELEMLEKQIQTELGDESVILRCRVVCIEDIAEQREFEIVE